MTRLLALSLLATLTAFSANAGVCKAPSYKINDLVLTADGKVLRTELVEKLGDGQNKKSVKLVSVVKDSVTLLPGDELVLNAAPQAMDVIIQAKIVFVKQDRDAKGIFSTTYRVNEIMTSTFGGPNMPQNKSVKTYLAKVVNNYEGNGTYNKGCGEVVRTMVEDVIIKK